MADLPGLTTADRAILLAAVYWADANGELWPSAANWARMSGVPLRSFHRRLDGLERAGTIVCVYRSIGGLAASGRGRTSRYRIPCFVVGLTVPYVAQLERPELCQTSDELCQAVAHSTVPSCGTQSSNRTTKRELPTTTSPVDAQPLSGDAVVVASLIGGRKGEELVRHKNATPELLAWIVSNASEKDNPGGWAVEAIRTPYEPSNGRQRQMLKAANRPPPTPSLVVFGAKPGDAPPKYGERIKRTPEEVEELRQIIATHKKGKAK